ncbi:MAG: hypothetical protein WC895_05495 [Candidatus Shapirobacteria bacterium]|jgi:hypothetical protein
MAKEMMIRTSGVGRLEIFGICTVTGAKYGVEVDFNGWKRWKEGELIQKALPDLDGDQREFLISGYTPAEWERLFPTFEDEDD